MRFWLDDGRLWVQCPHMDHREQLPLSDNDAEGWRIRQAEPLTVTPSIDSTECGCHGSITDGQWHPVPGST